MPHLATARRPSNEKTRPVKVNLLGTEAIVHVPNTLTQLVQHTGGLQRGIAGFHGIFITGCLSSISRNKQGRKPVPGEFDVQHMEHRPAYRASLALDITLDVMSILEPNLKEFGTPIYPLSPDAETNARLSAILNEAAHVFDWHAEGLWPPASPD